MIISYRDLLDCTGSQKQLSSSDTAPDLSMGARMELENSDGTSSENSSSPAPQNVSGIIGDSANSSTSHQSLSMEAVPLTPKPHSKGSQRRNTHGSRASRPISSAMMSEVSQWMESNPFEDSGNSGLPQMKHQPQENDNMAVDMGDFRSSDNSFNLCVL